MPRDRLERALAILGGVEADVVRLHSLQGLSFEAVAAHQNVSLGVAKSRYYRAMVRLQEILRRLGESEQSEGEQP